MKFFLTCLFISFLSLSFSQEKDTTTLADSVKKTAQIPLPSNNKVDHMIDFAKKFLGTPYRYAGSTPAGFDCSGFIKYILNRYDIDITRTSASMANYGTRVKLADVRKGDLLFFKGSRLSSTVVGHVGMVIENKDGVIKFIHSMSGGVQITTFNNNRYFVPRFIVAKRLDYNK